MGPPPMGGFFFGLRDLSNTGDISSTVRPCFFLGKAKYHFRMNPAMQS